MHGKQATPRFNLIKKIKMPIINLQKNPDELPLRAEHQKARITVNSPSSDHQTAGKICHPNSIHYQSKFMW